MTDRRTPQEWARLLREMLGQAPFDEFFAVCIHDDASSFVDACSEFVGGVVRGREAPGIYSVGVPGNADLWVDAEHYVVNGHYKLGRTSEKDLAVIAPDGKVVGRVYFVMPAPPGRDYNEVLAAAEKIICEKRGLQR